MESYAYTMLQFFSLNFTVCFKVARHKFWRDLHANHMQKRLLTFPINLINISDWNLERRTFTVGQNTRT